MKKPVHIHIPAPYQVATNLKHKTPANLQYRLAYTECNHWKHPKFSIVEQYYDGKDVFACLAELHTDIPLTIPITCERYDLYWIYQLKGNYHITDTEQDDTIFHTETNCYMVIDMPGGAYLTHFAPGTHLLFYYVVSQHWLMRHNRDGLIDLKIYLDSIHSRVKTMNAPSLQLLPSGPAVRRLLLHLFCMEKTIAIAQDARVYDKCILLLQQSLTDLDRKEHSASHPTKSLIDQIRIFIHEQLRIGQLPSVSFIASHFGASPASLWRYHKQFYESDLYQYIQTEKLNYAYELISQTSIPLADISFKVGYASLSTFTRAFKHCFDVTPSHLRSHK